MKVHVVVVGTAGNQRYIFASNKRRENVGASHLITCVEGRWLDETLEDITGAAARDARIEDHPVEIVTANAGGVTALVKDRDVGRELVAGITRRALREAPGLDVCGVVGEPVEWRDAEELAEEIRRAYDRLPAVRMARPGPQLRFPGLPIVERCGSSGLPAKGVRRPASGEALEPRSAAGMAKLDAFPDALGRLAVEMGLTDSAARRRIQEVVDYLGFRADWVAVVHADGNGMGEVFRNFDSITSEIGSRSAREYIDALRGLSTGVGECALEAFRFALRSMPSLEDSGDLPPVLPLVIGGDDLTVVCDGKIALRFAERYLREFAKRAREHEDVGGLLELVGQPSLGACAGVAIVKRQYPFHSAVQLSEELTREAKTVKRRLGRERCALSFHVLYESAFADLKRLRAGLTVDGARLTAQPYVLEEPGDPDEWLRGRRWADLRRRVAALSRTDGGERRLPRSQAHELRTGLFLGREVADARFTLLRERLDDPALVRDLTGPDESLFWEDDGTPVTGLLDAMDAEDFLPDFHHEDEPVEVAP
ncbi:hypothetical protein Arub01_25460 [Actinomadura rubrobrunea]|uniref:Cas10/Cmr2 second palm domain-containing protein n=1 Tax=Actinomadura rubrobrunea TaxID=115335 RepID=A0A9W6PWZ6_9ACTN|nr:hypothetical protein [Actinomadura rubrobrunea]GLW64302.1 hypothetical protein Arub01_25460 [Actinomadura rubrobrunea]